MVILDEILDRAANTNVHEAILGMSHRGRLNMLANIVRQAYSYRFFRSSKASTRPARKARAT